MASVSAADADAGDELAANDHITLVQDKNSPNDDKQHTADEEETENILDSNNTSSSGSSSSDDDTSDDEDFTKNTDDDGKVTKIDQEVERYLHLRGRALSPEQTPSQALRAAAEELLLRVDSTSSSPRRSTGSGRGVGVTSDAGERVLSSLWHVENVDTGGTSTDETAGKDELFEPVSKEAQGVSDSMGIENSRGTVLHVETEDTVKESTSATCTPDLDGGQTNARIDADDKAPYDEEAGVPKKQLSPVLPCMSSVKRPRRFLFALMTILVLVIVAVAVAVALVTSNGGSNNNKKQSEDTAVLSPDSNEVTPPQQSIAYAPSPIPSVQIPAMSPPQQTIVRAPSPRPSVQIILAMPETTFPTSMPTTMPTKPPQQEFAASPQCTHIPYEGHNNFRFAFRRWGTDKPVRFLRIYTPQVFDPSRPNKVIFLYHGRTDGWSSFLNDDMQGLADEHGYVLVAVDGLSENDGRSFTFPGSADGIGRDGMTATTCNTTQTVPNSCTQSCQSQGRCTNRCGFASCSDDDIELFIELVNEIASKYVCVDLSRLYVYGYDRGGMLAWSLAQDPRSAPMIAGVGAVQALPLHDYLTGKGSPSKAIPAIGIYSDNDCVVPPGDGSAVFSESCDGEGYRFVDAFRLHKLWAEEHGCTTYPAKHSYEIDGRNETTCSTHCNPLEGPPLSVDCRNNDGHEEQPWHLDIVMKFFEDHWHQSEKE